MTVEQLIRVLADLPDHGAQVFVYNVADFEVEPVIEVEEAEEGEVIIKY